jgi:hypothetical protein
MTSISKSARSMSKKRITAKTIQAICHHSMSSSLPDVKKSSIP